MVDGSGSGEVDTPGGPVNEQNISELAAIIEEAYSDDYGLPAPGTFEDCADAILAAGWRPPARSLASYDELDALSAVDPNAVVMWIDGDGITHATEAFTASCMDRPITWPASVLWESGDPR